MTLVWQTLSQFWATLVAMAPWLLFGFFFAGVLRIWFSPERISNFLGQQAGWRSIALAVALGVPLPLCSCGVLPVAAGLRKSGAGKGATAAFLIATPQTGVDSFFATWSLLGGFFAFLRVAVAVVTGIVGGLLVDAVDPEKGRSEVVKAVAPEAKRGWLKSVWGVFQYGYGSLFGGVAKPLFCGLVLSALIVTFVPPEVFSEKWLGNDWLAFPVMLLVGMPMYVCSTASIPVALALIARGISPGAALVFLIVGPALNGASLTTLWVLLGRRCTWVHLGVVALGSTVAGLALNGMNALWQVLPAYTQEASACCKEGIFAQGAVQVACAVVLATLLVIHLVVRPCWKGVALRASRAVLKGGAKRVVVRGMACDHCRGAVTKLLQGYPGVERVTPDGADAFCVEGELPESLAKDIEGLGFALERVEEAEHA